MAKGPENLAPLEGAIDWRAPKLRRSVFQDFYEFSLRTASFPGMVYSTIPYLRERYEWDQEQTLWFAFLNGNTQHPLSSLMLHRRGSRPQNAYELLQWYYDHRTKLGWDTDRRYHRRALDQSVWGYLRLLNGGSQHDYWHRAASAGWSSLWKAATAIPTFGRLSAWSLCDYLHICGIEIEPTDLMLEDRDGSRSHRNGLCIVGGLDVYDWHASNPNFGGHYPARLLEHLAELGSDLLVEAQTRAKGQPWARDVSYLTLESALCTYKSWTRPNRRYPGVYADMLYERIRATERAFPEEPLDVFWEARQERLPRYLRVEDNPGDPGLSSVKQNHYRLTGEVPVMGHAYPQYWSAFDTAVQDGAWTREEEPPVTSNGKVVLVCGEWKLPLRDGEGGYYHYVNERAGEVGRNAACIRWLLEELADLDIQSVVEPFGGVGVFATVVQGVCQPREHLLYDLDEDCLAQLQLAFRGVHSVAVRTGDAQETIGATDADLYIMDFPSPYTVLHHDKWAAQWQALVARKPKAFIWMDGASFGMQWHAKRYGEFLDHPIHANEDYAHATSVFMHRKYGYAVRAATVSRGCFYFAAVPAKTVQSFEVRKFTTAGCALTAL